MGNNHQFKLALPDNSCYNAKNSTLPEELFTKNHRQHGRARRMKNGRIICGLFLLIACLVAALSPQPVLAQDLQLSGGTWNNKVIPGRDNVCFVEVRNTGKVPITNIVFSSYKPEGWVVEFKPGRIDYLAAGSSQTIDVNIKPTAQATKGWHTVSLIAEASETRQVMNIMKMVETSKTVWLWVGAGLAVVVTAAFTLIFMRYGRQ